MQIPFNAFSLSLVYVYIYVVMQYLPALIPNRDSSSDGRLLSERAKMSPRSHLIP